MTFQVVHAEDRPVEGIAQGVPNTCADQQRTDKSGSGGHRDGINLGVGKSRLGQGAIQQRQHPPNMVARCKLWHDAAIVLMHFDLRKQRLCKDAALAVDQGDAGFIAGRFKTEDDHAANQPSFRGWGGVPERAG